MLTRWGVGDIINGRWEVFGIRSGGMGLVYLCYDPGLYGDPVALKTLRPEYLSNRAMRLRFIKEGLTWVRLGGYHGIVVCHGIENVLGDPYIRTEYIPDSLRDIVGWGKGSANWKVNLTFAIQVCQGMEYVTRRIPGMVHRDIKPENIRWHVFGLTKITDFGLAGVFDEILPTDPVVSHDEASFHGALLTRMGQIVGTPAYMSPEQWNGEVLDMRSDIYSFGCVLYELVTGKPVFVADSPFDYRKAHCDAVPPRTSSAARDVPPELDDLVSRCLAKRPAERFRSWREIISAICAVSGDPEPEIPDVANIFENAAQARNDLMDQVGAFADGHDPDFKVKRIRTERFTAREMEQTALFHEGISLINLGEYGEALCRWNRALELDPKCAEAWVNKGATLSNYFQKHDEALVCIETALRLNSNLANGWNCKGTVLRKLGREREAEVCFQTGRKLQRPTAE